MDPLSAFCRLQQSNPARAFLLSTSSFSIISCSPKLWFIKWWKYNYPTDRWTYRKMAKIDQSLIERFLRDPKEVADTTCLLTWNAMTISHLPTRKCTNSKFPEVESYSHLHHLVSTISGRLKKILPSGNSRAMLPGGSITGCPKPVPWMDRSAWTLFSWPLHGVLVPYR